MLYGDLFVDSVYKGLHGSYFIHMQALQNVSYTIFRYFQWQRQHSISAWKC